MNGTLTQFRYTKDDLHLLSYRRSFLRLKKLLESFRFYERRRTENKWFSIRKLLWERRLHPDASNIQMSVMHAIRIWEFLTAMNGTKSEKRGDTEFYLLRKFITLWIHVNSKHQFFVTNISFYEGVGWNFLFIEFFKKWIFITITSCQPGLLF